MSAELVNAILNIRSGLKRDNIIKHFMIMTEIPEAVTLQCFIGTSSVCNENNTAESCVNADNCDYFPICILTSLCVFVFISALVWLITVFFSGSSSLI